MKTPLLTVFIGITYVLSKSSKHNYPDSLLKKESHLDQYYAPQHHLFDNSEGLSDSLKKDVLEMVEEIEKMRLSARDIERGNGHNNHKILTLLSKYFKHNNDMNRCTSLQKSYFYVAKDLENQGKNMGELTSVLSNEEICEELLKHLDDLCNKIKLELDAINSYDKNVCDKQLQKCLDLKKACKGVLDKSCEKLKDQCKTKDNTTDESTTVPIKDFFTKTHT
ncbi:hypothetical protein PCANB_001950, partial [Pneumocystis canis]